MNLKSLCFGVLLLCFLACSVNVSQHNYLHAGRRAQQFVEKVLIEQKVCSSYHLVDPEFKKQTSCEEFERHLLNKFRGWPPKKYEIKFWESYGGGREVLAFLIETKEHDPKIYLRVTMIGADNKGYLVRGFNMADSPFAAEGHRLPYDGPSEFGSAF